MGWETLGQTLLHSTKKEENYGNSFMDRWMSVKAESHCSDENAFYWLNEQLRIRRGAIQLVDHVLFAS